MASELADFGGVGPCPARPPAAPLLTRSPACPRWLQCWRTSPPWHDTPKHWTRRSEGLVLGSSCLEQRCIGRFPAVALTLKHVPV